METNKHTKPLLWDLHVWKHSNSYAFVFYIYGNLNANNDALFASMPDTVKPMQGGAA